MSDNIEEDYLSDNEDEDFDHQSLKFQLAISKSQKKKFRQKIKAKTNYLTKSQSGTSKHTS